MKHCSWTVFKDFVLTNLPLCTNNCNYNNYNYIITNNKYNIIHTIHTSISSANELRGKNEKSVFPFLTLLRRLFRAKTKKSPFSFFFFFFVKDRVYLDTLGSTSFYIRFSIVLHTIRFRKINVCFNDRFIVRRNSFSFCNWQTLTTRALRNCFF